eukprot:Nk52_evm12s684 gene=Nk52_evmTU12s684
MKVSLTALVEEVEEDVEDLLFSATIDIDQLLASASREANERQQNLRAKSTKVNYEGVIRDFCSWYDLRFPDKDRSEKHVLNAKIFDLFMNDLTKEYCVAKQHNMLCKQIEELTNASRGTRPSKNCCKVAGIIDGDESDDEDYGMSTVELSAYAEFDKNNRLINLDLSQVECLTPYSKKKGTNK